MNTEASPSAAAATTISTITPDWNWVRQDWKRLLAFGFGSGLAPKAPGTFGTLAAIPLYWLLYATQLPNIMIFALCVPLFALGVWVCDTTGKELGEEDFGGIVWDEIVAFILIQALIPTHWLAFPLAFVLFRFFDITKPFPIRLLERKTPGGLGVMLDDLLAAIYTLMAFYAIWYPCSLAFR